MRPTARRADLEIQPVDDEVVVYDTRSDEAHCLHALTVQVWDLADGTRTVDEIAAEVGSFDGEEIGTEDVWTVLDALGDADLLVERAGPPAAERRITRRTLVRRVVAASALGAVPGSLQSILVPTAAHAQSGVDGEQSSKEPQSKEFDQKVQAEQAQKEAVQKSQSEAQQKQQAEASQKETQQKGQQSEAQQKQQAEASQKETQQKAQPTEQQQKQQAEASQKETQQKAQQSEAQQKQQAEASQKETQQKGQPTEQQQKQQAEASQKETQQKAQQSEAQQKQQAEQTQKAQQLEQNTKQQAEQALKTLEQAAKGNS